MKTFVVSGGTDGIGKAVALTYLRRGDQVAIIGRSAEKGAAFLADAARLGAADRAHFLPADLSLVSENRKAVDQIRSRFSTVDALVLCARHYRSTRLVTAEGFEHTFALFYLSRFVLSYELLDLLDAADNPVIMNVCGPGADTGQVRWHDLNFETDYHGLAALAHGGLLNDLLGVGFAQRRPAHRARYVLFHPGTVSTSFSGQYTPDMAAQIEAMRSTATPVAAAVVPILALLDQPPTEPLSAFVRGEPIGLAGPSFNQAAAQRLYAETRTMLSS
ncbi:SDR family NAD(P)-dependent oxidoreductase [Goodfellowiella coeruleoviolacea]|uniref:NAD(P)-dependent dehydrogenase, short-chain alcohol dehydrogenase family n=1 Tax=Goodfellowiella coeruleoviolacea TaxID=334858 RepID=A0AAE3KEW9_9PSEU|nr:SDR family NAD(P)-dependent oxidoreductase [Goodfellowiella coeruleoviolacea]MCP2164332.1 NAD(P)-dependent dehydrogenase, short-chain alcohol dehydrogenase family [Goodfellowiella coeruleoviolacea]